MEMSHQFDTLMDGTNEQEMEDQTQSNFIAYLRMEKMNNRTLDFRQVYDQLEPLAYSHALIVLNQKKLVKRLLNFLKNKSRKNDEETVGAALTSQTVIRGNVLELIVALVKDLR